MFNLKYEFTDFIFRTLFSLIFIALGFEHIFRDQLIQNMIPDWLVYKRLISLTTGVSLLSGGFSLLIGYKVKYGAILLGGFLIVVTLGIHVPALLNKPSTLPEEWYWLWDVYQQSNIVKNFCLLGGCFHLTNHKIGRFSLEYYLLKNSK